MHGGACDMGSLCVVSGSSGIPALGPLPLGFDLWCDSVRCWGGGRGGGRGVYVGGGGGLSFLQRVNEVFEG